MPKAVATLAALAALAASSLATAAAAQGLDASVEVYGVLVPQLEYIRTTGATPLARRPNATQVADAAFTARDEPFRLRLTAGTSHVGLRGSVDLAGDDLQLVWQVESAVPIDGDPIFDTFPNRNSRVGLSGAWGTLFFGIWDNPYKQATVDRISPIGAGFAGDETTLLGTPGFNVPALNLRPSAVTDAMTGAAARSNAAFHRRDANSIQYASPSLYGLALRASYTTNELSRSARSEAGAELAEIEPDVFSGLVSYERGSFALRYGIEVHRDYFGLSALGGAPGGTPTNPSSQDVGQQGLISYRIEFADDVSTRLVAAADYLFYENDDRQFGNVDQYQRAAFYALIDQGFRAHHLWAAYGQAEAGRCSLVGGGDCSTEGLGARLLTLGYVYRFSPDTAFWAVAYRVDDAASGAYGPFPPSDPLPAPGADVQSLGIGLTHHFSAAASTTD